MRQSFLPLAVGDVAYRPDEPPCLDRYATVQLDAETTGLSRADRPVGWAVGAGGRTWYLPVAHPGGGNLCEATVRRWMQRELRGKRIENLHTKFDIHVAERWGVPLRDQDNTFHDVAHSEALLDDHHRGYSLNALAAKRLGDSKLKLDLPGAAISQLPASVVAPYAKQDVALVDALADVYRPLLREQGLERVSALEDAVIPAVVEMEANGMPLDMDLLTAWERSSAQLEERLAWDLYRLVGFVVNPDAPTDMARLWRAVGEPIMHYTAGARPQPSFTAPVVLDAATRHPAILLAWRVGKLRDLRNKYLVKYLQEQEGGILYPTLNQLMTDEGGTVSGRFSCVKPNLQQVMGKDKHGRAYGWLTEYGAEDYLIKRLFVPPAGRRWVSADMKQVEYRVFAHYTESEALLARYAADPEVDFHNIVRTLVERVRPTITRTEVKTFNFLKIFGGGIAAAARNLNVSEADAAEISQAYDEMFPEASALARRVKYAAEDRGWVRTFCGRRGRFLGAPGSRERTHKALNVVVQGTAADINKLALVAIYAERRALDLTMRLTTHDSLDGDQGPEAPRLTALTEVLNTQRLPLRVPILWDVKHGPSWAEAA